MALGGCGRPIEELYGRVMSEASYMLVLIEAGDSALGIQHSTLSTEVWCDALAEKTHRAGDVVMRDSWHGHAAD